MKVNSNIFCNSPWFELHIYWNGDYGFCCQQFDPPYFRSTDNPYNIKNMSIQDWYNSDPMRDSRQRMFSNERWANCSACWTEEDNSDTSRRHRANQKSVIFRQSFDQSLAQSPNVKTFEYSYNNQGQTQQPPIDLHIDLGNYCNLACKMCWSGASSKIATQEKKWGTLINQDHLGTDWTSDVDVWQNFLSEMKTLPLKNVHFMGGETMIQPRFTEFVDSMIEQGRTDLNISFVTNGTNFDKPLMDKLSKFNRVGIEVSIETTTDTNHYVRQGTKTPQVIKHLDQYATYVNDRISVTVRPAMSALTIRDFHTLLRHCLDNKFLIKALIVENPIHMQIAVLPKTIRNRYKEKYIELLNEIGSLDIVDINESDPRNYVNMISLYARQAITLLEQPEIKDKLEPLVTHMKRWDQVYGYNARDLYPELTDILDQHGY